MTKKIISFLTGFALMSAVIISSSLLINQNLNQKPISFASDQNECSNRASTFNGNFENPNWEIDFNVHPTRFKFSEGNQQQVVDDPTNRFDKVLRVSYPAGSITNESARDNGTPPGGSQFLTYFRDGPVDKACLSYSFRFNDNFQFVKGGKLPGLFGGLTISGGSIPNGTNGFSTRYMWRQNGAGEVYAYLPTSNDFGTSLSFGNFRFEPGTWYNITQEVVLNTPRTDNGIIKTWINGDLVLNKNDIRFRTVDTLKIEGIFFSTFFGGNDPTWATPVNTHTDFANFRLFDLDSPISTSPTTSSNPNPTTTSSSSTGQTSSTLNTANPIPISNPIPIITSSNSTVGNTSPISQITTSQTTSTQTLSTSSTNQPVTVRSGGISELLSALTISIGVFLITIYFHTKKNKIKIK